MESAGILRCNIKRSTQRAERPTMKTVTMSSAEYIRARGVNSRVDHKGRGIEHAIRAAVNDFAGMIDLDQI